MEKIVLLVFLLLPAASIAQSKADERLAKRIVEDERLDSVKAMALRCLEEGFSAGAHYRQVWIRDLNTFIEGSLQVYDQESIREALVFFFRFQGFDGSIPDGYETLEDGVEVDNYHRFARYDVPDYAFFRNTVETDQESSLVQAVYTYVKQTGDRSILSERINGKTLAESLAFALEFVRKQRFSEEYGLVWGGTTADWGDIQHCGDLGVKLDHLGLPAIDVYDNAMYLIALNQYEELTGDKQFVKLASDLSQNIRKHLWDEEAKKFRPHVYFGPSPFTDFDEDKIYYHGGTAVAILAGLLSTEEVESSLVQMRENVRAAGAQTVGLNLYPPYPEGAFQNPAMVPFSYQNGGDWTWFGGRVIHGLMMHDMTEEAYSELSPMLDRAIANHGFFEYYTIDGNPHGSDTFKGSAGVLYTSITALQEWAAKVLAP